MLRGLYQEGGFVCFSVVMEMGHSFSVEMSSSKYLGQVSISQDHVESVLFEGDLGRLEKLAMIEEAVLVVQGSNGVLRIDLSQDELKKLVLNEKSMEEKK